MSPRRKRQRISQDSRDVSPSTGPLTNGALSSVNGTIVRIKLKHFMCHTHADIELNERVTFVTGANGSGKSAALTGVMVALGAAARNTDRARTLKNLIQRGRSSCLVSVTLRNTGPCSYKPDKYGHSITVDRILQASGSGCYCIRDSDGRVVSRERRELACILDSFNIQVDNPVTILTQETSKNFLRTDDPQLKYKLFLRATCMEQIRRDYDLAQTNIDTAQMIFADKKQGLASFRVNVERMERQLSVFRNIDRLNEQITTLNTQIHWAKVKEAEEAVERACEQRVAHERLVAKADTLKQSCQTKLQDQTQKTRELEEQLEAASQQLREKQLQHDQLKEQLASCRQQLATAAGETRQAVARTAGCRQDRDNLHREIERVRKTDYAEIYERQRVSQQRVQQLDESVQQLNARQNTRATHAQHVAASVEQARRQLHQAQADYNAARRQLEEGESELQRLRVAAGRGDSQQAAVYGSWLADTQRAIAAAVAAGKFQHAPIGPLGAFVKLQPGSQRWAPLVECCLRALLSSFLVDNQQDMILLKSILRNALARGTRQPQIICSRFLDKVHDVSRHGIDPRAPLSSHNDQRDNGGGGVRAAQRSVWSTLHVDSVPVANAVIDHANVESVLLLENDRQARDIMSDRRRVPRGCSQALTLTGYRYYPDPKYRTYPVRVESRARYLQVSADQAISHLQEEIAARRSTLRSLDAARDTARQQLQQLERQLHEAEQQVRQTSGQLAEARRELRQLQNEPPPELPDLKTLEDEVAQLDRVLIESDQATEPLQRAETELSEQCQHLRHLVDECRTKSQLFVSERMQPLSTQLSTCVDQTDKLKQLLARHADKRQQLQQRLTELTDAVATAETSARQLRETASGDRVDVDTSSVRLEQQLAALRRTIADGLASLAAAGDRQQLELQWRRGCDELQRIVDQLDTLGAELAQMATMMEARDRRFHDLRLALSQRMVHLFMINLQARHYTGRMTCDHVAGKLHIVVQPSEAAQCTQKRPQQLSGGERSFSTLCFILALWDVIDAPFRMLDEFDVFMDEVNRKIGHDILLNSALSSMNQFVFISPLSLPSAANNQHVSVLRMQSPR